MSDSPPAPVSSSLPRPAPDPSTLLSAPVLRAVRALVEDAKDTSPLRQSHISDALLALDTPDAQYITLVNEHQTRKRTRLSALEAVALAHGLRVKCRGACIFEEITRVMEARPMEGESVLARCIAAAQRCADLILSPDSSAARSSQLRTDLRFKIIPIAIMQHLYRFSLNRLQSPHSPLPCATAPAPPEKPLFRIRMDVADVNIPPPASDPARPKKRKASELELAPDASAPRSAAVKAEPEVCYNPARCSRPNAPAAPAAPVVVKPEPEEGCDPAPAPAKLMPVTIFVSIDDAEALAAAAGLAKTDMAARLDLALHAFGPVRDVQTAADAAVPDWMDVTRVEASSLEANLAFTSGYYTRRGEEEKTGRVIVLSSQGLCAAVKTKGFVDCVRPDGLMALLSSL